MNLTFKLDSWGFVLVPHLLPFCLSRPRSEAAGGQGIDFKAFLLFIKLPIAATPVAGGGLGWWFRVAVMPSSKATPALWIALLDCHLGVAVADNLALPILTCADYKFARLSRCTPRTIAWQFSRIQGHLPHLGPKRQESSPGATGVPSGGFQRSLTAS